MCVETQPWLSSYSHTWDKKTKCSHTAQLRAPETHLSFSET